MTDLATLESHIECYQASYELAAKSLLQIHETGAWKNGEYQTWEEYLKKRWDFQPTRAKQLMNAGQVLLTIQEFTRVKELPPTERVARELYRAKEMDYSGRWPEVDEARTAETQANIWEAAVNTGERITAEFMRAFVDKWMVGKGKQYGRKGDKDAGFIVEREKRKFWNAIRTIAETGLTPEQLCKDKGYVDIGEMGGKALEILQEVRAYIQSRL